MTRNVLWTAAAVLAVAAWWVQAQPGAPTTASVPAGTAPARALATAPTTATAPAGDAWQAGQPYPCRRAEGKLDVDVSAPAWRRAPVIRDWFIPISHERPKQPTELRLLWDEANLYAHFVAHDEDLRGTLTGKTDHLWSEDVCELFLQPDTSKTSYYEYEVNPINGLLALRIADPRRLTLEQRADWPHKTGHQVKLAGTPNDDAADRNFQVLMTIPFADLDFAGKATPKPGDTWRFIGARCNLGRPFEKQELSACVKLTKIDFHLLAEYPTLKFEP